MCSHGLDENNSGMLHQRNKTCQKGFFIGEGLILVNFSEINPFGMQENRL
jgi:hypothetical protein